MTHVVKVDRRDFLKSSLTGAAGLFLGFHLPFRSRALAEEATAADALRLNAFIRIGTDDTVTFFIHKSEMGQGTVTSLSMLLAEELECDWKKVRTRFPGVDPSDFGRSQGVFGSQSVATSWKPLREAGAKARAMLIQAAAVRWGVDPSKCRAEDGSVVHPETRQRLSYGRLAEAASKLDVPASVTLKTPEEFRIIGKPTKRLDTPDKVCGKAVFGIDVRVPGMLFASIERGKVIGGKVKSFDATKAKQVPGVQEVVQIPNGVAVVANSTGAALRGRDALVVDWDTSANGTLSSEGIHRHLAEKVAQPGRKDRSDGDADAALKAPGHKTVEATYEVPFLAHAPLELSNCTAHVRADGCDVWAPTQMQSGCRDTAAKITGLKPESIQIHTTYLGGGFGRRIATDFIEDAIETSKAMGRPVQITWRREDDMRHSAFRPTVLSQFAGAVDGDGWPVAWKNQISGGLFGGTEGAGRDLAYAIPNMYVDGRMPDRSIYSVSFADPPPVGVPVTSLRSVDNSQNTFFVESFLDELAHLGGKDPVEVRRRLLQKAKRLLGVLELAAEKAGWGHAPAGRFQGIAIGHCFGTYVAEVAEVSVVGGKLKLHRVVAAVDCGQVVNPAGVRQQAEGAIVFGLTAALYGRVTLKNGVVQEDNLDSYQLLRMDQMPAIEVHLVESHETPTGMGEPAVPPAAPALCNAIFAATGKRIRTLPIVDQGLAV
jgi:isoquinoline 1-oxidoreductase beta subunit